MRTHSCWSLLVLLIGAHPPSARSAQSTGPTDAAAEWQSQIEADWLTQESVRWSGPGVVGVTTQEDALGACDGVKDGKWGFHTELEENPWWQVDLGEVHSVARVVIYNRCDIPERASRLILLLSDDGTDWRQVYQHDGQVFYGFTDGNPLSIPLDGLPARFVRIQLPGTVYLHFDEVEVYGPEDDEQNLALYQPADQSSVSQWSQRHARADVRGLPADVVVRAVERGLELAAALQEAGVDVQPLERTLRELAERARKLPPEALRRRTSPRCHPPQPAAHPASPPGAPTA